MKSRNREMLLRVILLLGLTLTLGACAATPSKISNTCMVTKPTIKSQVCQAGMVCMSRGDASKLAGYIIELETCAGF